ncbi:MULTISPECIES: photosynthetic reaction center subunit H [Rhodopseudomonas]|jgi:photosynthetic reaction center H subunit|uniref:photosynthetic reaction center subunit H n=1 Tax=Rhodopseudomonas TaxID=1073 RepID=UPI000D1A19B7|nr:MULTISPECIES: photosynthetic reaction center subunit H [Rhodopseudomonas]AVT75588.1 photosynthetic reaction center subunit H [Rhodopseudomonas palustris]AVT80395.1 photosynthetic reaction center subunit H [Rhodopseudomonas palustris]NEW98750.1 photosynthetic reaction center subunit H [Rhodopseudomonas sp. BR0G17]
MQPGAYLDLAQVTLYVFWIFFAGLLFYLRREDKREGYPLVADAGTGTRLAKIGVPAPPDPKTYLLRGGATKTVPSTSNDRPNVALAPSAPWPGAPFVPTGNPFADGVGPGSYAQRADVPELGLDNLPIIAPLRAAKGMFLDPRDPNPVGMSVVGCDGVVGGTVTEVWVDRAEVIARYLEVEVAKSRKRVLLPVPFALINDPFGKVSVDAIRGDQFAGVPTTSKSDQVSKLEEDKICAYYGAGTLYATPMRSESIV